MNKQDIFGVLNDMFTDEDFLLDIASKKDGFFYSDLMESLNIILSYYIVTRDTRRLSFKEINTNYNKIKNNVPNQEEINNILTEGYLTHSFPGVEKKYVEEYGLDYFDKLLPKEKNKLQNIRRQLVLLEENIEQCSFIRSRYENNIIDIVEKELFMTFPGKKTMFYSTFTPERLYYGPIDYNLFQYFPLVAGESKKDYLLRMIMFNLSFSCNNKISNEEIEICANNILDYYTKDTSCIAFINIKDIIDIPIFTGMYNYDRPDKLRRFYDAVIKEKYSTINIFTHNFEDAWEEYGSGDFVTLSSFINKESISLVDFPDWYNLRQAFIKRSGIKDGTLVSYLDCKILKDKPIDKIKVLYK